MLVIFASRNYREFCKWASNSRNILHLVNLCSDHVFDNLNSCFMAYYCVIYFESGRVRENFWMRKFWEIVEEKMGYQRLHLLWQRSVFLRLINRKFDLTGSLSHLFKFTFHQCTCDVWQAGRRELEGFVRSPQQRHRNSPLCCPCCTGWYRRSFRPNLT